jgi:hypothetical protein
MAAVALSQSHRYRRFPYSLFSVLSLALGAQGALVIACAGRTSRVWQAVAVFGRLFPLTFLIGSCAQVAHFSVPFSCFRFGFGSAKMQTMFSLVLTGALASIAAILPSADSPLQLPAVPLEALSSSDFAGVGN